MRNPETDLLLTFSYFNSNPKDINLTYKIHNFNIAFT